MVERALTHVTLNPLDHFPPSNYTFFCSYLPLKVGVTPDEVFKVLQEGLRRWRPGQLEIRYDAADFEGDTPLRQLRINHLNFEEFGVSYEDLKESEFPLDAFEDEQLTTAKLLPKFEDAPDCFSAQANFVQGACLLVVGTQHAVCDGTSYFDVWKVFAGNCDSLQQPGSPWPDPPTAESSDRTLLDRIWEKEGTGTPMAHGNPETWSLLDLQRPGAPKIEAATSLKTLSDDAMQAAVFYVSPENFSALQKRCAEDTPQGTNISGNDALSALIWRFLLKAKRNSAQAGGRMSIHEADLASTEARLFLTLDGRPGISHALPMLYLGNLFFINICSTPLSTLTAPDTSLGDVTHAIRSVINKATRQTLIDAYTLAREVDDLNSIRLSRGHTPNSFDMVLSSLLMFSVEGVMFGGKVFANGGRPDAVRPLMRRFNRASQVCFIMPRKAYGGVEFVCNLFEDEMNLLLEDEEFGEWCMHYSF